MDAHPNNAAVETRRAIRLVAGVAAAALAIYALMGVLVREDATLTGYGLEEQVHFAARRAAQLDRAARWGEQPIAWIVGSSVARESFDEFALREALPGWGVEKFAFDRGGPVFVWAFLDRLDVRPGDVVITPISYDHFRRGWLAYHDRPDLYLHFLTSPSQIARIQELSPADRIEYALAHTPPSSFWHYREAYAEGLGDRVGYALGLRKRPPRARERAKEDPFQGKRQVGGYRDLEIVKANQMADDEMVLGPGQVNHDGLTWFIDEVRARGAEPWLIHVPANPEYYDRFVEPRTPERFHAHMEAIGARYERLSPRPVREYMDYRHPNYMGRAHYTAELAALIGGAGGDPSVAEPGEGR